MSQIAEFIGNNIIMSVAFIIVLFMYISIFMNEKMQKFSSINSTQLTQLVNQKGAVLLDVRPSEAFDKGHIANALNIPLSELTDGKTSLKKLKDKTVIVYCEKGISSISACKHLTNQGLEPVLNLGGGINTWLTDKLPLVKK